MVLNVPTKCQPSPSSVSGDLEFVDVVSWWSMKVFIAEKEITW